MNRDTVAIWFMGAGLAVIGGGCAAKSSPVVVVGLAITCIGVISGLFCERTKPRNSPGRKSEAMQSARTPTTSNDNGSSPEDVAWSVVGNNLQRVSPQVRISYGIPCLVRLAPESRSVHIPHPLPAIWLN